MQRIFPRKAEFAVAASLVAALSAGCTSIPRDMASPLSLDPGAVQLAMIVPKDLVIRKGDAVFSIAWRPEGGSQEAAEYLLDVMETSTAPGLPTSPSQGERVSLVSFAATDAAAYRALRQKILDDKASGKQGRGTIAVNFRHACWNGAFPQDGRALPVSIYIRSARGEPFAPLGVPTDLRQLARPADGVLVPTCAR